jgi:diguanylate cyclase (GGDEF)-like protein
VRRALDAVDLRIGVRAAAATFVAGALLIPIIALPIWKTVTPAVIGATAAASLAGAFWCVWLIRSDHVSEESLYVADFAWIAITAALVAGTGGRSSPFFLFYPLPVLHAGAFQSQRRLIIVSITATLAFLTPLLYDHGHTGTFVSTALMAVPPTLIVAWGFNVALTTLRRQRRELSAAAARAEQDAHTDALTGLGNFRQLWGTLERETSRARRHGEHFSLIVIDLDRFKAINDAVGHLAGDAVLKAVGSALQTQLRGEDVCCRHGGDEFAIVAVGSGEREAGELAVRLLEAIATVRAGSAGHTVGAAAGWATFTAGDANAENLMREADAMLLERKYGRGR